MSTAPNFQSAPAALHTPRAWLVACFVGMFAMLAAAPGRSIEVAQSPLYVGSNVPGNLALVPSVEFPTVVSAANLQGTYTSGGTFVGYFDSLKCYSYQWSDNEAERYFYPVSVTSNKICPGRLWSGNFLNWAATQTIDPFRSALTGGYRVRDNAAETWLEKAWGEQGGTGNFEHRSVTGGETANATPAQWGSIQMRIIGLGNKMRFGANAGNVQGGVNVVSYNPSSHPLNNEWVSTGFLTGAFGNNLTYEVSIRVKVCDASVGLEANCVRYPNGQYKPEGLIQEYSNRILYSAFSYQNVDGSSLDGGVLRANQKFVGPQTFYPEQGALANPNREWDPETGIQIQNPDPSDATATNAVVAAGGGNCGVTGGCVIRNSGVINYINKFGQMNTGKNVKSQDNVSELYYAATRYFKNLPDVPEYNVLSGDATNRYRRADGFPIITNWREVRNGVRIRDPMRYACQTNAILGIGDTNTWQDKNLPSATATAGSSEPTKPALVREDTSVDVIEDMVRIFRKEFGWSDATARARATRDWFNNSDHKNSGYIAALAYDANTRDIRPASRPNGFPGVQTISTYWVDVIEGRSDNDYKTTETNQYYLATKYGGFKVPAGYDPDTNIAPLDNAWWTAGDTTPRFTRPTNFYAAADATRMVASLRTAFQNFIEEMVGSGSALASSSTRLETGVKTFQAQFYSGTWRGDLRAFDVNASTGALTQAWSANDVFVAAAASNANHWQSRTIKVNAGTTTAGSLRDFTYAQLNGSQQSILTSAMVDYLRGNRSGEAVTGPLRLRTGLIGDIINSEPVYVGAPNNRLYLNSSFTGASSYPTFAAASASRRAMVYVGANDGMLHGFDATTGAERFAFVPSGAINASLRSYTQPGYEHRYLVDGDITVADVYDTTLLRWRSVLVGTLGRGGNSIYALDVTDPANVSLLWEIAPNQMGQALGKPVIAQIGNGQWRVLIGNGPNSSGERARLLSINVFSGAFDSQNIAGAGENGLSSVNVWASSTGGFFDTVYAGDLKGRLWKVGVRATGTGTSFDYSSTPLYSASRGGVAQPIIATPLVARDPDTSQTWVFFGTGRYLAQADLSDLNIQTWYGLKVPATGAVSGALREVSILAEGIVDGSSDPDNIGRAISQFSTSPANGWYLDLVSPVRGAEGERMVVPNRFQGLALVGTSRVPDPSNICSPAGKGYTMGLSPFTGSRLSQSFFDVDGDGSFTDTVDGHVVSGIGLPSSPNNPIFIGNVMQVSLEDGSTHTVNTNSSVMDSRRVSWRELVRD